MRFKVGVAGDAGALRTFIEDFAHFFAAQNGSDRYAAQRNAVDVFLFEHVEGAP